MIGPEAPEDDDKPKHQVITVEPAMVVLTPYALARSSHHLYSMVRTYEGEKDAWLIRLYLFCAAIELGLKAAILADDCSKAKKKMLKHIGHDLVKLDEQFAATFDGSLFGDDDIAALTEINPHFRQKGLEYFTTPVLDITLKGGSGLPDVEALQVAGSKVDSYLEGKEFLIDGKTSQPPSGGILHFV